MIKKIFFSVITLSILFSTFVFAQQWFNYTKENGNLNDNEVRSVCIDKYNNKWFATKNGLTLYNGKTWKTYTIKDGLAGNSVNSIIFDDGDWGPAIWAATDNGVSVIGVKPDAITFATPYRSNNTGLVSNNVRAIAVDNIKIKWFGTDSGVSSFDGNVWASFTAELNSFLTSNDILSIFPLTDFVMFGTLGGGVSRFDSITQATPITTSLASDVIASDVVYSMYASKLGDEWFGTDSGLSHHTGIYPGANWTTYKVANGLADNSVRSILAENDSLLWIGTDNGLNRFDGTNWLKFTTVEGLAGNKVLSIAKDVDGSFWLGTNSGISHYTPSGTSVEKTEPKPGMLNISAIYPNPFNMNTTISFNVPSDGYIELEVYNLAGQKVRTLISSWARSGSKHVVWDGYDNRGLCVSSGIYIARVNMGGYSSVKKMTVIK